jgi:ribonuclease VapC
MFIDASALCAVLLREPGHEAFEVLIAQTDGSVTSPVAVWETVRAIVREQAVEVDAALTYVERYLTAAEVRISGIPVQAHRPALEAFERFGKGRHPAALNMGDCFAYACARSFEVPLLFKGDDFPQSDIEPALTR